MRGVYSWEHREGFKSKKSHHLLSPAVKPTCPSCSWISLPSSTPIKLACSPVWSCLPSKSCIHQLLLTDQSCLHVSHAVNSFLFVHIYCTSTHPGWGIPPLLFSLIIFPVKGFLWSFSLSRCEGSECRQKNGYTNKMALPCFGSSCYSQPPINPCEVGITLMALC